MSSVIDTMEKKRLPPDFDWVTARHQCSVVKMFELLHLAARKNAETMTALAQKRGTGTWEFAVGDGSFSVVRRVFAGIVGVRFTLREEQVIVEGQGVNVSFVADLTLNNEGDCRFLVQGEELDQWQVLRRAFEPLFFGNFR